jgi:hypothetical protein
MFAQYALSVLRMSDYISLQRVAEAAGVAVSTVSRVLSVRGNLCRITPETQSRSQLVAQQLGYRRAGNIRFTKMAKLAIAPALSATPGSKEISLVISTHSAASRCDNASDNRTTTLAGDAAFGAARGLAAQYHTGPAS